MNEKRSLVGLHMYAGGVEWLEHEVMPAHRRWQANRFGIDGTLLSLMTEPLENGNAQLFSAVVSGIGKRNVGMWSLGRVDFWGWSSSSPLGEYCCKTNPM